MGSCVVDDGWSCSSFICCRLRKFCCCIWRLRCSSAICDWASAAAAANWYAGYACRSGEDMKQPRLGPGVTDDEVAAVSLREGGGGGGGGGVGGEPANPGGVENADSKGMNAET